jgi:hypothetical protein
VRHEQHRRVGRPAPLVDQVAHGPLAGEVQREQRLVAQQHLGVADQGLRHTEPLLLAAGQPGDRRLRERLGAHFGQCLVHPLAAFLDPGHPGAPTVPVQAKPDEVAAPQRRVDGALLRDVADAPVAASWRRTNDLDSARRQRRQPEQHAEQARLAGPVRAKHRDELTPLDVEVEAGPQDAVAVGQRRVP